MGLNMLGFVLGSRLRRDMGRELGKLLRLGCNCDAETRREGGKVEWKCPETMQSKEGSGRPWGKS